MTNQFPLTNNPNLFLSSQIIDELYKNGITEYFVSPGMRNAPLIAAINSHPETNIHLGMDERAHSYAALGFSKGTGSTSCLVCTSGTALSNYYPAILEAHKSEVPLLILSADRPEHLVIGGDNQTINQKNIYGQNVRNSIHIEDPLMPPKLLRTQLKKTLDKAHSQRGPVHINVAFDGHLDSTKEEIPHLNEALTYFRKEESNAIDSSIKLPTNITETLSKAKNPLLIIGELPSYKNKDQLLYYLNNSSCLKYFDITSGLKFNFGMDKGAIPSLDHPEVFHFLENQEIDMVLHLGGRLVSKHYYRFLAKNPHIPKIQINDLNGATDPSFELIKIKADPEKVINQFPLINISLNLEILKVLVDKKRQIIESSTFSFPAISKAIIDNNEDIDLYIGNSTAIRSFDSYANYSINKDFRVHSHRGVSGIEGPLAASSSLAKLSKRPMIVVLGDVSFFHDLNSLIYMKDIESPYICLLINNGCGGIFSLLPIHKDKETLKYLSSPHELNFKPIIEAFNIPYAEVTDVDKLNQEIRSSLSKNGPSFIEAKIDNESNVEIYNKLKTIKL